MTASFPIGSDDIKATIVDVNTKKYGGRRVGNTILRHSTEHEAFELRSGSERARDDPTGGKKRSRGSPLELEYARPKIGRQTTA